MTYALGFHPAATRHLTSSQETIGIVVMVLLIPFALPTGMYRRLQTLFGGASVRQEQEVARDPLRDARDAAWEAGGGAYLGMARPGEPRFARSERAVLVLGPPDPVSHCSIRDRHCANSPASD